MGLNINSGKYKLPESEYFSGVFQKDKIVLHFTAGGSVEGAYQSWLQSPVQVATAFIVDLDGTAYQCFNPASWAYHLGIQGKDANHSADKSSIGIEIVNWGPLKRNGNGLFAWPNDYGKWYCDVNDPQYVMASYRGFDYYARFPLAQFDAVCELTNRLCELYSIPKMVIPNVNDFQVDRAIGWKGICTHQNFRKDKFDIGPAWSWDFFNEKVK